jgi:hypothetical protein
MDKIVLTRNASLTSALQAQEPMRRGTIPCAISEMISKSEPIFAKTRCGVCALSLRRWFSDYKASGTRDLPD